MNRKFNDGSPESGVSSSEISDAIPAAPAFGEAAPIRASPQTLAFLARRRSASALSLGAPAPDDAETRALLTIAARVPDHGKLAPWRFIILRGEAKTRFVAELEAIAAGRPDGARLHAKLAKLRAPPLTIAVVSRHLAGEIPEWEQRLSAGAVCMTLVIAAQAMGHGANWITDWYAYDPEALELLGLADGERVAGFVHIGAPAEAPLERVRPDAASLTSVWDR
jgi:nitroreductase